MTKAQMELKLQTAEAEIEKLQKVVNEREREFLAIGEAKRRATNEEVIAFLTNLFEYDENGCVTGFNPTEVNYYCWLSKEPARKKAL